MTTDISAKPRNVGGRPIGVSTIRIRAARHVDAALAALVAVTTDTSASAEARVTAASRLLDIASMTPKKETHEH